MTLTFASHGDDHTLMTIRHEQLPPEQVTPHELGWERVADQLANALAARA